MLRARLRTGAGWRDACILNISSRGLMIRSGSGVLEGSCVEVHRGDHVIAARVAWRDGAHDDLQSDERVPVEEIMSESRSSALQLVASDGAFIERRKRPRQNSVDSRLRGRAIESFSMAVVAGAFGFSIWGMAQEAFAAPLAKVEAALGG